MTSTYTTIVKKDGDWWIGWIEEFPGVNAQERSKADLLRSLRLILREALEFNRAAAQKERGFAAVAGKKWLVTTCEDKLARL